MGGVRRAAGWSIVGTVLAVALATPIHAQVRGTIVGPGATSYPIAVSPLKGGAEGDEFADVVARDLDLSGLFKVIDRAAYIENPQASGVTADSINFDNWRTIG